MNCPFCPKRLRDLFALSLHLEDEHEADQHRVQVVTTPYVDVGNFLPLRVVEVDIDAIHRKAAK